MHRITKGVAIAMFSLALALGFMSFAYAENDNGNKGKGNDMTQETRVNELKVHIKALQDQIQTMIKLRIDLQTNNSGMKDATKEEKKEIRTDAKDILNQMKDVRGDAKAGVKFIRSLMRGMSGDDVRDLQELLAQDPTIYPEGLITGFFGPATERALKNLQRRHGIEQAGVFGPKTKALIHGLFEGRWPPGIMKRFGIFASTTGTSTPLFGQITICHYPPGNLEAKHTLTIGIAAFAAHLLHGDKLGACEGSTATTTPPTVDTTAPVISGLAVSGISSTTAAVSWNTNENAVSKVYYATSSPVNLSTALSVGTASSTMAHMHMLTGLSASTTQYFVVESKDAANNTATSSTQSFLTL